MATISNLTLWGSQDGGNTWSNNGTQTSWYISNENSGYRSRYTFTCTPEEGDVIKSIRFTCPVRKHESNVIKVDGTVTFMLYKGDKSEGVPLSVIKQDITFDYYNDINCVVNFSLTTAKPLVEETTFCIAVFSTVYSRVMPPTYGVAVEASEEEGETLQVAVITGRRCYRGEDYEGEYPVVGYESSLRRVTRYAFQVNVPASTLDVHVYLDATTDSANTMGWDTRIAVTTDPNTYINYSGTAGTYFSTQNQQIEVVDRTIENLVLLPNTTYYLWMFPAEDKLGWAQISEPNLSLAVSGTPSCLSIDNGTSFNQYSIYIDNGSSWDMYQAYIDNGSGWDMLC